MCEHNCWVRTPKAANTEPTNQSQNHSPSSLQCRSIVVCILHLSSHLASVFAFFLHVCLQCVSRGIKGHRTRIPWQWSRGIEGHTFNESLCVVLPSVHFFVPFTLSDRAIIRIWLRRCYQSLIHGFRNEKKPVPLFSFIHRDELRSFGNLVLVGPLTDRPWPVHDEDKDDTMTPITKELVDRNRDLTLHESWAATATETDTVLFVCFICLFVCLMFVSKRHSV